MGRGLFCWVNELGLEAEAARQSSLQRRLGHSQQPKDHSAADLHSRSHFAGGLLYLQSALRGSVLGFEENGCPPW
jgi:hypothetical protein